MKKIIIIPLCLCALLLLSPGCGKVDLNGNWELTLTWDERSVFEGEPPPPTILRFQFRDGKLYKGKEEAGIYDQGGGDRIKIRPTNLQIMCYGHIIDENHMEGEISYYPASAIYGTWTAVRL
jgi:hypothetical protein